MNHFNIVASTWDSEDKIIMNKKYSDEIKNHLNFDRQLNILEVGCGTGLLGLNFVDENSNYLGVDTSDKMLEILNLKTTGNKSCQTLNLNLENDGLPTDKKFNLIISSMAFHHLKKPAAVLDKLKTYLENDGVMAIIDLDLEDGTFHPNPIQMKVEHFGFAKDVVQNWSKQLSCKNFHYQIVNEIKKENKSYPIFLSIFKF